MHYTARSLFVFFTFYNAAATLTYLLKHRKGKRRKENLFVFLCSLNSFFLSTHFFALEAWSGGKEYSIKSKFMCAFIPVWYHAYVIASKVFQNLIFTYRYKTLNLSMKVAAAKRADIFSVVFVIFSIAEFISDVTYFTFVSVNSEECVFDKAFLSKHLYYSYVTAGFFVLKILFQTIMSAYIIKPIATHFFNNNASNSTNKKIESTLYRIIWCTLSLTASDVCFVLAYVTCFVTHRMRAPIFIVTNVILDSLMLIFSYADCKERLFPFVRRSKSETESSGSKIDNTTETSPA